MNSAMIIIFGFIFLSIYLGIQARKGKDMDLEQWTVGKRGFGSIFVFLLMAGETYTTVTFLGGSGWAYDKGGPALYLVAYISLMYVLSYWLLPAIWKYGKENNLVSQPDFYVSKYKSPALGIIVALIGVLAIIPYIVLQLKGLGIIVSEGSYGKISPELAIWIGAISITIYVMISGIHGSAWTAVLKDILILIVVVFMGIYIPFHYFGGIQPMFEAVEAAKPGFLALPESGLSISWFISTVLLTVLGVYMWPHFYGAIYSAKNGKSFRKNAIISPLYTLILLFVFLVGYTAIVKVPNLKGTETDLALLRISIQTFDPWFVGVIGAAGLLTALVPGSMLLMAASTSLSKNVYKVFVPTATEKQVSVLAKLLVPVVTLVCVYFTFNGGDSIVTLLLMGYSFVTQLAPALLLSLMKNNFVTKQGAAAGMIIGVGVVAYTTITQTTLATLFPSLPQLVKDINVGVIALSINVAAMLIVSLLTKNVDVLKDSKAPIESTN
jgi:SSS family solute:Na+ symporter